jgi:uncharacterized protein
VPTAAFRRIATINPLAKRSSCGTTSTMATAAPRERIASLDIIRGVAVMGILVANLPGFALPEAAYFSPLAWGGTSPADIAAWFATYVLVEGKMRGLFTFLFGASMLLVIDAAGDRAAGVHFRRMATLFLIGCLHLYLFWWGDILAHYALVGSAAFLFRSLSVRWLIAIGMGLVALQWANDIVYWLALLGSAARDTPAHVATWNGFAESFGVPPRAVIDANIAGVRSGFVEAIGYRWQYEGTPFAMLPLVGLQTLGAMLFGMAAYRSGLLTGAWPARRYARWALICLGLTLPVYAVLGSETIAHGFDQRWIFFASIVAGEVLRPITVAGYATALMLVIRPDSAVANRLAAVGRAAFTNYLGTTLMMTFVFSGWGLGQFATWPRAALYLLAPIAWGTMLIWSPWWLARYRYGPLEWVWRTLARGRLQTMRG